MKSYELIIIGAGPAGLSAACAAHKEGLKKILIIDRLPSPGGILSQCLHRGFTANGQSGVEFRDSLLDGFPAEIEMLLDTSVVSITPQKIIEALSRGKAQSLHAEALIIATGCRETPVGSLPIAGTRPAGIFTAGSVQKMLNISGYRVGNEAVILGSGDVGMIVAHHLYEAGVKVLGVVEKRSQPGGMLRNKSLYLDSHGIPLITNATVTRLFGKERLTAVTVSHSDGKEEFLQCDTLISSLGLVPELELLREFGGTLPPWLHLCGNAKRVHSLVDSVVAEGQRVGHSIRKRNT